MKNNWIKKGLFCASLVGISLLFCGQKAEAGEIPSAEQLKEYKEDGTLERRIQYYKNAGGESYSKGLIQKKKADSGVAAYSNVPEEWETYMPSEGEAKILLLRVDFPDMKFEEGDTEEALKSIAFGGDRESYSVYPYESLKAYYERSSYGKLHISGDTLSYTAQHERSYYEKEYDDKQVIASLYKEVLDAIDPEVDFSQYDGNHDGYIDGLYLHFAGTDSGWASCWWSTAYPELLPDDEYDGMHVGGCATLHTRSDSKDGAQTLIHESGHLLGLSDYYNYDTHSYEDGLDAYDMMLNNIGDHNAFSKWLLGWITDDEIKKITLDEKDSAGGEVTLESLSKEKEDGDLYKCAVVSLKDEGMFSEYLLVEYDTELGNQTGLIYYGKQLPAGFRIFHVNAKLTEDKFFQNNNTYSLESKLIQLVDKDQSVDGYHNYDWDGSLPMSKTEVPGKGESYGCKYLEGDSLTPDTTPSTDLTKGQFFNKSGISITGFHPDGDTGSVSIRVDKVVPTKDDLKVTIETKWQDINQNNIILLPVTISGDVEWNEEKLPYLMGKDGNKVTGRLVKGNEKGKYFIIIQTDYLKAGEYECVLPEGAFSLGTEVESDEQKVSLHVGENMKLKASDTLHLTNTIISCKAEDAGWYILAPKEADGAEGYLYKISEEGKVTEQKIDVENWKDIWGYDPESMVGKDLKCLPDGTLAAVFEDYNAEELKYVHLDKNGKVLDDVVSVPGMNWESYVVGNTIKVQKNIWGNWELYSIEFGKGIKKLEYQERKTYRFMKDGYLVYSLENKAPEEAEGNEMWAVVEYRNAQDELVHTWECPYGEEKGQISLASIDGAAETDTAIYMLGLNPKGSSGLRDDYVLSDMHLELYSIDKKTGKFNAVEVKDEPLRAGVYKDIYSEFEISDISEQDGKILFTISNWFNSEAAAVDDTYCVDLNRDVAITKRIGHYYSTASVLSGTKVMEIDWTEESPKYLIYDAGDGKTPENPKTPEQFETMKNPKTPSGSGNADEKNTSGKGRRKAGTQTAKKASNAKTGDTSELGVYGILLCMSGSLAAWYIRKKRYGKE